GKPSTYLIEKLLEMHRIKPSEAAFVGDRLDIDIRMANKMGMRSVLVLTGVSKREEIASAPASDKPDIVLESAVGVGKALRIY
ncbi:MAG: HAD hydrolase-like protein, partial [Candidatus Anstonellaceae archaeon]